MKMALDRPYQPAPHITLGDPEIALRLGRVHELCGPARHTLALAIAAQLGGPVVWITPLQDTECLCPDAMMDHIDLRRLLVITPATRHTRLWAMEDALRDGCASVVVADLTAPLALVSIRRLHLAAEVGCSTGPHLPIALLLAPDDGGAPGIETRWSLDFAHHISSSPWTLNRLRARMAPPRAWQMAWGQIGLTPTRSEISYEISAHHRNFVRNSSPLAHAI